MDKLLIVCLLSTYIKLLVKMCDPCGNGYSLQSLTHILVVISSNTAYPLKIKTESDGHDYIDNVSTDAQAYVVLTMESVNSDVFRSLRSNEITFEYENASTSFEISFDRYGVHPSLERITSSSEMNAVIEDLSLKVSQFSCCSTDDTTPWPHVLYLKVESKITQFPKDVILDNSPTYYDLTFSKGCSIILRYRYDFEDDAIEDALKIAIQYGQRADMVTDTYSFRLGCDVYTIEIKSTDMRDTTEILLKDSDPNLNVTQIGDVYKGDDITF